MFLDAVYSKKTCLSIGEQGEALPKFCPDFRQNFTETEKWGTDTLFHGKSIAEQRKIGYTYYNCAILIPEVFS